MRNPSTKLLKELYIYLHGRYDGKGDMLPLGQVHLHNLEAAIRYIAEKQAGEEIKEIEKKHK